MNRVNIYQWWALMYSIMNSGFHKWKKFFDLPKNNQLFNIYPALWCCLMRFWLSVRQGSKLNSFPSPPPPPKFKRRPTIIKFNQNSAY